MNYKAKRLAEFDKEWNNGHITVRAREGELYIKCDDDINDDIKQFISDTIDEVAREMAGAVPKRKPEPNQHAYPFSDANTAARGWNDARENLTAKAKELTGE